MYGSYIKSVSCVFFWYPCQGHLSNMMTMVISVCSLLFSRSNLRQFTLNCFQTDVDPVDEVEDIAGWL